MKHWEISWEAEYGGYHAGGVATWPGRTKDAAAEHFRTVMQKEGYKNVQVIEITEETQH